MNKTIKYIILGSLIILSTCATPSRKRVDGAGRNVMAQSKEITRKLYKTDIWPRETEEIIRSGVNISKLKLKGFVRTGEKFYRPEPGTTYLWQNKKIKVRVQATIQVCATRRDAYDKLIDYLTLGNTLELQKDRDEKTGNLAFYNKQFPVIAFVRDNVEVVVHGAGADKAAVFETVLQLAGLVDGEILGSPVITSEKGFKKPGLYNIEIIQAPGRSRMAELVVTAQTEAGRQLKFAYFTSHGSIVKGREGKIFIRPAKNSSVKVKVIAGNEYNVVTEMTKTFTIR